MHMKIQMERRSAPMSPKTPHKELVKSESKSFFGNMSPRKSKEYDEIRGLDKKDSMKLKGSTVISAPVKVDNKVTSDMSDDELNRLFTEVVDQMNLKDPKKRQQMMDLPREHKITMVMGSKERTGTSLTVDKAIKGLREETKTEAKINLLKDITVQMKTAPVKWTLDFVKCGGFSVLTQILSQTNIISGTTPTTRDTFSLSGFFEKVRESQSRGKWMITCNYLLLILYLMC